MSMLIEFKGNKMWEFTEFSDDDLDKIITHCEALENLGIEQDEDMMRELYAEKEKRKDI